MSNLGEGIKIEHTMDSACCPYTKKNCFLFLAIYILFPLAPIICLIAMCYYSNNPEIQMTKHVIQGTLCPNCKLGKIKYSMIADGKCTDVKSKELFLFVDFSKQNRIIIWLFYLIATKLFVFSVEYFDNWAKSCRIFFLIWFLGQFNLMHYIWDLICC